jgi:steroid delta-isomerase-like uncharacterized protein
VIAATNAAKITPPREWAERPMSSPGAGPHDGLHSLQNQERTNIMETTEMKKSIVRRYYEEIWCNGNVALVDELMAPEYENCDPATPGKVVKGRDGFKALVGSFRAAFPDLRLDIVEQFAEGDVVISRWFASGTHRGALMGIPATGRRPEQPVEGFTLTRFVDGRIVQDRAVWDTLGLLRQLGAFGA